MIAIKNNDRAHEQYCSSPMRPKIRHNYTEDKTHNCTNRTVSGKKPNDEADEDVDNKHIDPIAVWKCRMEEKRKKHNRTILLTFRVRISQQLNVWVWLFACLWLSVCSNFKWKRFVLAGTKGENIAGEDTHTYEQSKMIWKKGSCNTNVLMTTKPSLPLSFVRVWQLMLNSLTLDILTHTHVNVETRH